MRVARSVTVLILAAAALLGVLGIYARSQPAGPEVRGVIFTRDQVDAIARSVRDDDRLIALSGGTVHVDDAPLAMLRSGASVWFLFAAGALLMVGGSVMPLARWYAEEREQGAALAGMLPAAERAARDEARARRALEEVVDDLGGRLDAADARLPDPALPLVAEAIATAYGRGVVHGMRRAADDLEAQMAALGVDLRIDLEGPEPGDGPGSG